MFGKIHEKTKVELLGKHDSNFTISLNKNDMETNYLTLKKYDFNFVIIIL